MFVPDRDGGLESTHSPDLSVGSPGLLHTISQVVGGTRRVSSGNSFVEHLNRFVFW